MNDTPIVEDCVDVIVSFYDIDTVDGALIGEFARRSVVKRSNAVGQERSKSHN